MPGRGLARAALVIGSVFTLFGMAFFIAWLTLFLEVFSQIPATR